MDSRTARQENAQREWSLLPNVWLGASLYAMLRLLVRNRFAVSLAYIPSVAVALFFNFLHSIFAQAERAVYGRRVRRTAIRHAPLFIIGHWRTGTTFLHDLLTLDERHTFPSSYDCFSPSHFLLSGRWLPPRVKFAIPSRRPMDNMAIGWETPQEDEFALALSGVPSPYNWIPFPNHPPPDQEYLDFEGVPPEDLEHWKTQYHRFLQRLTFRDPRRLVLKSPTHTGRVAVLSALYPDAGFIHIVRDPYRVFVSSIHLWRTFFRELAYQRPHPENLEEYVFSTYLRLHRRLEEDRKLVKPGRFHELRYEDLVRNPIDELRKLYDRLELGGFEACHPRLEAYLNRLAGYETNHYEITPKQCEEITRRWGEVIRRYGYPERTA